MSNGYREILKFSPIDERRRYYLEDLWLKELYEDIEKSSTKINLLKMLNERKNSKDDEIKKFLNINYLADNYYYMDEVMDIIEDLGENTYHNEKNNNEKLICIAYRKVLDGWIEQIESKNKVNATDKKIITLLTGEKMIVNLNQLEKGVSFAKYNFYLINDKMHIEDWLTNGNRIYSLGSYLEKRTKEFLYVGEFFYESYRVKRIVSRYKYMFDLNKMEFVDVNELLKLREVLKYCNANYEVVKVIDIE